ncbi:MAG: hypothetical protein NC313_10055 [Butyrivibrio sp.]|nr:hypothetical protein [Butyrivibrio sp.]
MSKKLPKIGITFLVCFLLTFMLFIFGPSEIFFANVTGFKFVYGDFGGYMAVLALAAAVILTAVIAFLPDKIYGVLLSIVFGISLAGYIQVMFLNKNLDLLGVNPEGYKAQSGAVFNLIIWLVIIAAVIVFSFVKFDIWKKFVTGLSAFLLCIQLVALISLLVSAGEEAYHYPEGKWHLSGEEQYTVSADKNVIILVLDYFSNQYLAPLEQAYPNATDFLHDFTYYNNADCTYFGTFPSLPHMLTGKEVVMSQPVNDWCMDIWEDEETYSFYNELKKENFKFNVYTPDTNILCGLNDVKILDGRISNVANEAQEIDVFYKLLFKTMAKMSSYRMFPELLKPYFYANIDEYEDIVAVKDNKINHNNYDFYQGLMENGLKTDKSSNYVILQHLMGTHLYTTDENGNYKEDSTLEETAKGCMVIVEDYLNRLKELGVYDDATIIVTADHGGPYDSQVIFYIKEPNETHDVSPITNAPISFREFMPTIAKAAGLDVSAYGQTIYDFSQDELRERTVWLRMYDENYPAVQCYTGEKDGSSNVYYGYTYTGDIEDLLKMADEQPSVIEPIADSYF